MERSLPFIRCSLELQSLFGVWQVAFAHKPLRYPTSLMNTFYYGDDLNVVRGYIKDESVDLVYLDQAFVPAAA
jgi:hypothetical protein